MTILKTPKTVSSIPWLSCLNLANLHSKLPHSPIKKTRNYTRLWTSRRNRQLNKKQQQWQNLWFRSNRSAPKTFSFFTMLFLKDSRRKTLLTSLK